MQHALASDGQNKRFVQKIRKRLDQVVSVAEIKYGGTFSLAHKCSFVKIKPVNFEFNWIKIPFANKTSYPIVYRTFHNS